MSNLLLFALFSFSVSVNGILPDTPIPFCAIFLPDFIC